MGGLARQGAYPEHLQTLEQARVGGVPLRQPRDLEGPSWLILPRRGPTTLRRLSDRWGLGGLVIPGGASTTMRRLIARWGLGEPLAAFAHGGAPVFGTCAGMIVLAREISGGEPPILPLLDVTVRRNAFGRQL